MRYRFGLEVGGDVWGGWGGGRSQPMIKGLFKFSSSNYYIYMINLLLYIE